MVTSRWLRAAQMDRVPEELTQEQYEAEIDLICETLDKEYDERKLFLNAREELLKVMEDK